MVKMTNASAPGPRPIHYFTAGAEVPYREPLSSRSPASSPPETQLYLAYHHEDAAGDATPSLPPAAIAVSMASPPNAMARGDPGASPALPRCHATVGNFSYGTGRASKPEITSATARQVPS